MPLYEYQCEDCSRRFEVIQKFADAPVDTCPTCGGRVRRLLSSPAIQFKGSGWYVTDYARTAKSSDKEGGAPADTPAEKPGGTLPASEGAAKTDGAPAASAPTKTSDKAEPKARTEPKP
jgi:putative FmdB family regulatory protein